MKQIILTACFLTATLTVINTSNAQQTVVRAEQKLPPKVQAAYDSWIVATQVEVTSETYVKERGVYRFDFVGIIDYGFIVLPYEGYAVISSNGTFITGGVGLIIS
jgi:hypothetical protein